MNDFILNWYGDEWLKDFHQKQVQRMTAATILCENLLKKELGTKAPPHSSPGEYPHLQTGELRRSITHEVDEAKVIGRIGSNKIYARFLAMGTRFMQKRKWYEVVKEHWSEISSMLKKTL